MVEKQNSRKPTYGAAINVAWILRTLYNLNYPIAVKEICDQLGITPKTAHRYLKVLNENFSDEEGGPFIRVTHSGRMERWQLNRDSSSISSTAFQIVALVIGLRLMGMLTGTIIREGAEDIADALKERLTQNERRWIRNLDRKFYDTGFGMKSYRAYDDQLDVLLRGLLKQRKMKTLYQSAKNKKKSYTIRPYTLMMDRGSLYTIAHVDGCGEIRMFRIEKIMEAELIQGEGFEYPSRYRPEGIIQGGFGIVYGDPVNREEVVVEFDDGLYEYITIRNWHPSQRFSKSYKGKFTMTVTLDDSSELKAWIKSFSPEAKVIRPKWLVDEITKELKEALLNYEN